MLYRVQSTAIGQSGLSLQPLPGAIITVYDQTGALAAIAGVEGDLIYRNAAGWARLGKAGGDPVAATAFLDAIFGVSA